MENSTTIKSTAFTYGIVLGVVSIIMLVLIYVLNITDTNYFLAILSFSLSILVYFFGLKEFKSKNSGFISLTDALKVGLAIAVIGGLISAVYTYIHYSFVYPEFLEITLEKAQQEMLDSNSSMSDAQMEQALAISKKMVSPFAQATFSLVGSIFFGFIISLVIGLIIKKKNPALEG